VHDSRRAGQAARAAQAPLAAGEVGAGDPHTFKTIGRIRIVIIVTIRYVQVVLILARAFPLAGRRRCRPALTALTLIVLAFIFIVRLHRPQ